MATRREFMIFYKGNGQVPAEVMDALSNFSEVSVLETGVPSGLSDDIHAMRVDAKIPFDRRIDLTRTLQTKEGYYCTVL